MKKTIYECDRCGDEITDVAYTLTCYAEAVPGENPAKHIAEISAQNVKQNMSFTERHLCRKCKDEITAGIFIL